MLCHITICCFFFFQAEDGIRDLVRSRGLGDVYKRQAFTLYYRGLEADYSQKELEKIQNLELKDLNEYIKSHNEINNLTFSIVRK